MSWPVSTVSMPLPESMVASGYPLVRGDEGMIRRREPERPGRHAQWAWFQTIADAYIPPSCSVRWHTGDMGSTRCSSNHCIVQDGGSLRNTLVMAR